MKGDFSRDSFDASRHVYRVLMQQGRLQLDADWNEQAAVVLHRLETVVRDAFGPFAGPTPTTGSRSMLWVRATAMTTAISGSAPGAITSTVCWRKVIGRSAIASSAAFLESIKIENLESVDAWPSLRSSSCAFSARKRRISHTAPRSIGVRRGQGALHRTSLMWSRRRRGNLAATRTERRMPAITQTWQDWAGPERRVRMLRAAPDRLTSLGLDRARRRSRS
jgi:Family of unknown function (DUF6519)